jgi:hypothetical protein
LSSPGWWPWRGPERWQRNRADRDGILTGSPGPAREQSEMPA